MVGKCVRFLFTSCEGSLNERESALTGNGFPAYSITLAAIGPDLRIVFL